VLLLQGDSDPTQPMVLFDGSYEQIFQRIDSAAKHLHPLLSNGSHSLALQRTLAPSTDQPDDHTLARGKTAVDYFPSSSWVKFYTIPEAGHFLSLEAPDIVIEAILELLAVPSNTKSTQI
jgi:pimeloyl-ACP methyl ester carboxylesterase